jgi:preprotein translocase subunit SecA
MEAGIVAQAGRPGVITIATNMAGRGTDIVLGGNVENQIKLIDADAAVPDDEKQRRAKQLHDEWQSLHDKVKAEGGLRIIATERHESRRIDNQLRGRSGRQGDPGSSRFYLSLDDSLMRIFAGERVRAIMERLKMPDGEAIEAGIVTRSIEGAQRKVEARNFDVRKQLLEYDDVANDQRKVIYKQRNDILEAESLSAQIASLREGAMTDVVRTFVAAESVEEQWDLPGLEKVLREEWQLDVPLAAEVEQSTSITDEDIVEKVTTAANSVFDSKVERVGIEQFTPFMRMILLQSIDSHWRGAPRGARLPAPGHPPARLCAEEPEAGIQARGVRAVFAASRCRQDGRHPGADDGAHPVRGGGRPRRAGDRGARRAHQQRHLHASERRWQRLAGGRGRGGCCRSVVRWRSAYTGTDPIPKVGRNEPCPCGSGKKYKQCHGKLA